MIAYNIPDKIPAEKAKQAILLAAGMVGNPCRCVRLRKASPRLCCPLLLEFNNEKSATALLQQTEALNRHLLLSSAKLSAAHSPLQRRLKKSDSPQQISWPATDPCLVNGTVRATCQANPMALFTKSLILSLFLNIQREIRCYVVQM